MPKTILKLRLLGQTKPSSSNESSPLKNKVDKSSGSANSSSTNNGQHDISTIADDMKDKSNTKPQHTSSNTSSKEIDTVSKKRKHDDSLESSQPSIKSSKSTSSTEPATTSTDSNQYNNDRTIYIEGLPYNATEDDIRQFFSKVGHITSIRLPKWHDSGRLRGYGHIEFTENTYANHALDLDGSYMGDRYIKIDKPLTPKTLQHANDVDKKSIVRPPGCRSVFVKNIPYTCSEEDVTEALKVCGPITNVRLPMWGHTQQLKGFGYIDFKREDSAEIAVKKSGVLTIGDRPVIIDFETGTAKRGFKTSSAQKKTS